jgi:hypothetical protein
MLRKNHEEKSQKKEMMNKAAQAKRRKETFGVCGSRCRDEDFCDSPSHPSDKMREFSCEK